jgi:antitoxin component of RelBE/YafQ-DinJ toxin-antitoxin module
MKKGEGNKRRKSPSREKYEQNNPTVSGRVPKETHDRLYANLAKHGMSLTDALKVLAGELEVKVIPIDEARRAGYEEAKNLYMVPFPCSACGEMIPITNPKTKEAVSRYMTEHGWAHAECHKRRRQL